MAKLKHALMTAVEMFNDGYSMEAIMAETGLNLIDIEEVIYADTSVGHKVFNDIVAELTK